MIGNDAIEREKAKCQICGDPIGSGEPVVRYDPGVAHRFKSFCTAWREYVTEQDAAIAAMGVSVGEQ